MVKLKKISVLIIFFNEERPLAKTLKYLYDMDYPKKLMEVVCVDDGSTDNSAFIAQQYPVKLIRQKNQGLSASYNRGLKECTGEYIFALDAHMYLKNKKTLKLINYLFLKYKNIAGVCGTYSSLNANDKNIIRDIRRLTLFDKNTKEKIITFKNFTTLSSAISVYKRNLLIKNKFPRGFTNSYGEDTFIQILLHNQGYNFLYTPKIVGVHDARIDSLQLIKKMQLEITAAGNILLKASHNNSLQVPYLNYFLSFPLCLIIIALGYCFLSQLFLIPLAFFLLLEITPAIKVFYATGYFFREKFLTFLYILTKESIQAVYLPFYLLTGIKSFKQAKNIFKIVINWEIQKFSQVFLKAF